MKDKIILIGAYGFTGAMIARKLIEKNILPVLAGKSIDKLFELQKNLDAKTEMIQIDITEPAQLKEKLSNFDIIINCAGPFNLFSSQILNYAISNAKVYMDICGEQAFIKQSFDIKDEINAGEACVVHSLAFESCAADLMADSVLNTNKRYTDISTYYYFENAKYSRGSRYSMQAMKMFPSWIYKNNDLVEAKPLTISKTAKDYVPECTRALFVPYPELLFFSSKYKTLNAGTYYLMDEDDAGCARANTDQPFKSPEELVRKYSKQSGGPTVEERNKQHFSLILEATDEDGNCVHRIMRGNDTYELSATIMVEAVRKILNNPNKFRGLLLPSGLLGGSNLLDKMIRP